MTAAGLAIAAVGGALLYRAMVRLPQMDPESDTALGIEIDAFDDEVTDESMTSFPASDSPSWTPTVGATPESPRSPH